MIDNWRLSESRTTSLLVRPDCLQTLSSNFRERLPGHLPEDNVLELLQELHFVEQNNIDDTLSQANRLSIFFSPKATAAAFRPGPLPPIPPAILRPGMFGPYRHHQISRSRRSRSPREGSAGSAPQAAR